MGILQVLRLEFQKFRILKNLNFHPCNTHFTIVFTGDSLSTVECFDPILGRWAVAEAMSTMRSRVGVAVLNGKSVIL